MALFNYKLATLLTNLATKWQDLYKNLLQMASFNYKLTKKWHHLITNYLLTHRLQNCIIYLQFGYKVTLFNYKLATKWHDLNGYKMASFSFKLFTSKIGYKMALSNYKLALSNYKMATKRY